MTAILSPCGTYRYRLERTVAMEGPVYAFFGVNPSTADATADDATVRKWTGFVKRWGGSRFIVGNVFAFRATNVRELHNASMARGPSNDAHLIAIAEDADVVVPCWGDRSKVPKQLRHWLDHTLTTIEMAGKPIKCFGRTKGGDPLHPLMLGYDTPLVPYGSVPPGDPDVMGDSDA